MNMRSRLILVLSLLVVMPLAAQPVQPFHQATPVDQLLKELWAAHPEMVHDHAHHDHQLVSEMEPMPMPMQIAPDAITTNATKSFTIVARQFTFTVTPSNFVVNQGDSVTLDITSSDVNHGFILEQYTGDLRYGKGQHRTATFVANTPGTFTYACTDSSCGTGHFAMTGTFTVNAQATPPTITSFTPRTGSTSGGTVVAITGTNFQNGAIARFGESTAVSTTVNSATSINAISPIHGAGDVTLTVTNPDGQNGSASAFTYVLPPVSVASVSPSSGSNAGGTAITISGSNFDSGATVLIGSLSASNVNVVNANSITATTPPGPFDFSGSASRDVTVTNPDGRTATLTNGFSYTLPAPSITGISPNGSSPSGGNSVTITGTGFSSGVAMSVKFGGVAGTGLVVTSPTSLTVTAPAHAAGTVDVVVTAGSVSATSAGSFTYQAPGKKRRAVGKH
jgi:heme/copper-type cytochrome/quinol oxidase subunit 2